MDATGFNDSRSAAPIVAQQWMPPLWWPPVYPGPLPVAGGTVFLRGNSIFRGNDAFDYDTYTSAANTANAVRAIAFTGFSGCPIVAIISLIAA